MSFRVSLFDNKRDNKPKEVSRTWLNICERLGRPQIRAEKDGSLFSPAIFQPAKRLLSNVVEVSLLVLDCDHDSTLDGLIQSLSVLGCAFAIYSTHSHLRVTDNNPNGEPRFRVIIPLVVPIPVARFPSLWYWAKGTNGLLADEQAKDASRMYYTPVKASTDSPYEYWIAEGYQLDWRELDLSDRRRRKDVSEVNYAQVNSNLELCFTYHEERHAELVRIIKSRGKQNTRGNYDARCLAHNGKGVTSLVCFSATGHVHCNKGCEYFALLRAEGLPDGYLPSGKENNTSLPKNHDTTPWPELSSDAFYGLAGEIVNLISPQSEADSAALLIQTLVAFGNCAGRTAYFRVENDRHYLNCNATLVGATSKARKGTSWGQISDFFSSVDEAWAKERVQTGLSSGEGLIWAVRDPIEEKQPVKEKGRVKDYETVIKDHGIEDKRLLALESEFARVLRVMSRDSNTLSAVIRQAWDSGHLRIMTKANPAKATDAHISIIGHITAEELRRNLDETETANGFANRFLWVLCKRSKLLPEGGVPLDASSRNELISRLAKALKQTRTLGGELKRDDIARELWSKVYSKLSAGESGLLGSVTSRAEAQVVRLSCLYACLDCADCVRQEHLEAALALWSYCHESAAHIFGRATGDRTADAVVNALREVTPDGLTKTQLYDLFRRNKSANEIGRSLALLEERGIIRVEHEATEGRPLTRYLYLPGTKLTK